METGVAGDHGVHVLQEHFQESVSATTLLHKMEELLVQVQTLKHHLAQVCTAKNCVYKNYLIICAFIDLCEDPWIYFAHRNKCYKKSDDKPKDQNIAKTSCQSIGAELASIPDEETNQFIGQLSNNGLWIGGEKNENGEWKWQDGTTWGFSNWEPSTKQPTGDGPCLQTNFFSPGLWNDRPCDCSRCSLEYVCQKDITTTPSPSECKGGKSFFAHNNKCYKFQTTKLFWSDARKSCQADGGDLASVVDQETNEFIKNLASGYTWIGGYRVVDNQDVWGWTDGSVWSYENWASGKPDNLQQDVVAMYHTGQWDDGSNQTTHQQSYVCQYPIRGGKCLLYVA